MRILHANKFYFPKRGADRIFFNLTELLERHGHEVIPFSMQHPKNLKSNFREYFVSQVHFENPTTIIEKFRVLGRMMYSFEARRKLSALLDAYPCDIAHLETIYHQISPSILSVMKKRGMPIVMTVHDYKLMCPNYKMYTQDAVCERCFKHKYYNAVTHKCIQNSSIASVPVMLEMYFHKIMKFYERYVDVFLASSEFMKNKLVQWGFDEKKVLVLNNFIDTSFFTAGKQDQGYFLFSGGLEVEKGVLTIARAVKKSKKLRVVFTGTGNLEKYLHEFVEKNSLHHQIEFRGFVEREETRRLLQNCTALLAPSEWYDNNPLTIIEATACGKPVIGTEIGGIPELIEDGKTGFVIKPGDHIALASLMERLAMNHSEAAAMGRRALRNSTRFSPEKHYNAVMSVYNDLLAKKAT